MLLRPLCFFFAIAFASSTAQSFHWYADLCSRQSIDARFPLLSVGAGQAGQSFVAGPAGLALGARQAGRAVLAGRSGEAVPAGQTDRSYVALLARQAAACRLSLLTEKAGRTDGAARAGSAVRPGGAAGPRHARRTGPTRFTLHSSEAGQTVLTAGA